MAFVGGSAGRKNIGKSLGIGNAKVTNNGPGTAKIDFQYGAAFGKRLESSSTILPGSSAKQGYFAYVEVYATSTDGGDLNLDVGF